MPRFRRTQSFSVCVFSSISNRYTRYPGQSKILVNSRSVNPASLAHPFTFLRRAVKSKLKRGRVVKPELLDSAERELRNRSLQDIARINRWCGGHRVLLRVLSDLASSREKFSVLDVGAASGDMGQCIREAFPNAKVLLTDHRLAHLRSAAVPRLAADAFSRPFTALSPGDVRLRGLLFCAASFSG